MKCLNCPHLVESDFAGAHWCKRYGLSPELAMINCAEFEDEQPLRGVYLIDNETEELLDVSYHRRWEDLICVAFGFLRRWRSAPVRVEIREVWHG